MQDPNDYVYSYNPCVPYQGEYDCNTIHVSQQIASYCILVVLLYTIIITHLISGLSSFEF